MAYLKVNHEVAEVIRTVTINIFNRRLIGGRITPVPGKKNPEKLHLDDLKATDNSFAYLSEDIDNVLGENYHNKTQVESYRNFVRFFVISRTNQACSSSIILPLIMYIFHIEEVEYRNKTSDELLNIFISHFSEPIEESKEKLPQKKEGLYKIILIVDNNSESQKISNSLRNRHQLDEYFDVIIFNIDSQNIFILEQLLYGPKSEHIIGLNIFYTSNIHKNIDLIRLVDDWSNSNEDAPIICTDMDSFGEEIPFTFGMVEKDDADLGIWKLFVRSSERSRFWREKFEETSTRQQDLENQLRNIDSELSQNHESYRRKILLILIAFFLSMLGISFGYFSLFNKKIEKQEVEELGVAFLSKVYRKNNNLLDSNSIANKNNRQLVLTSILDAGVHSISNLHKNATEDNIRLIYFLREQGNIIEYACSSNKDYSRRVFKIGQEQVIKGIIACSFSIENSLIIYCPDCQDKKVVARGLLGANPPSSMGKWDEENDQIVFPDDRICRYDSNETDPECELRNGLLCLSFNPDLGSDQDTELGICLDVCSGGPQADPFLFEVTLQNELLKVLSNTFIVNPSLE